MNAQELFKSMQPYLMLTSNSVAEADMSLKEKQAAIGYIVGHFLGTGAHLLQQSPGMEDMELHELMQAQLNMVRQGLTKEALNSAESTE